MDCGEKEGKREGNSNKITREEEEYDWAFELKRSG